MMNSNGFTTRPVWNITRHQKDGVWLVVRRIIKNEQLNLYLYRNFMKNEVTIGEIFNFQMINPRCFLKKSEYQLIWNF